MHLRVTSVWKLMPWVPPLVWPLTRSTSEVRSVGECCARSGHGSCCMGILTQSMLPLWSPEMHTGSEKHGGEVCVCAHAVLEGWVGGILLLFLVARETCSACVCSCTRQTMAALLSILSVRPRWRFPPSANKGPGHPACLSPPSFPSIPPQLTSLQCRPCLENWELLPIFSPLLVAPGTPSNPWAFMVQYFLHSLSRFGFPFGQ